MAAETEAQALVHRIADTKATNAKYRESFHDALDRMLSSGRYTLGQELTQFEASLALFVEQPCCVAVSSGTSALELAFGLLELKDDEHVLVQANAFIASVLPICHNLKVLDVEPDSTWDLERIRTAITPQTRAVLVVHMYGDVPVNMVELVQLCRASDLVLIEDCAQALGSTYEQRLIGSFGHLSCFSFYPTKNLGGLGDAGAICTSNSEWAETLRMQRNLGVRRKYHHEIIGTNARCDELQAAFLNVKFPDLPEAIAWRRKVACWYDEALLFNPVVEPVRSVNPVVGHSFHLYVVQVQAPFVRDELMEHLRRNNIETLIHYPIPFYQSEALRALLSHAELTTPNNDKLAATILSLPMHVGITRDIVLEITNCILRYSRVAPCAERC